MEERSPRRSCGSSSAAGSPAAREGVSAGSAEPCSLTLVSAAPIVGLVTPKATAEAPAPAVELAAAFLRHLESERDLSQHTVAAYRRDLEQYFEFCRRARSDPAT